MPDWLNVLGIAISGAVALWVAVIARRPAERATEATVAANNRAADVESWTNLTGRLEDEVKGLRDEVGALRNEVTELRSHVGELERARDEVSSALTRALRYIGDLVALLRSHSLSVPPAPSGLDLD